MNRELSGAKQIFQLLPHRLGKNGWPACGSTRTVPSSTNFFSAVRSASVNAGNAPRYVEYADTLKESLPRTTGSLSPRPELRAGRAARAFASRVAASQSRVRLDAVRHLPTVRSPLRTLTAGVDGGIDVNLPSTRPGPWRRRGGSSPVERRPLSSRLACQSPDRYSSEIRKNVRDPLLAPLGTVLPVVFDHGRRVIGLGQLGRMLGYDFGGYIFSRSRSILSAKSLLWSLGSARMVPPRLDVLAVV